MKRLQIRFSEELFSLLNLTLLFIDQKLTGIELMLLRLGLCFVGSMLVLVRTWRWLGSSCLWSWL